MTPCFHKGTLVIWLPLQSQKSIIWFWHPNFVIHFLPYNGFPKQFSHIKSYLSVKEKLHLTVVCFQKFSHMLLVIYHYDKLIFSSLIVRLNAPQKELKISLLCTFKMQVQLKTTDSGQHKSTSGSFSAVGLKCKQRFFGIWESDT